MLPVTFCGQNNSLGCELLLRVTVTGDSRQDSAANNQLPDMVLWNEKFATGSRVLDQHHRTLIDNINHLEEMLTITNPTREDCEFMMNLVDFLEKYADMHFNLEEECMARFRCPAHAKNKKAHDGFLKFFRDFKEHNKAEGFRAKILVDLHETISRWIEEHILQVDTRLKPCIKA